MSSFTRSIRTTLSLGTPATQAKDIIIGIEFTSMDARSKVADARNKLQSIMDKQFPDYKTRNTPREPDAIEIIKTFIDGIGLYLVKGNDKEYADLMIRIIWLRNGDFSKISSNPQTVNQLKQKLRMMEDYLENKYKNIRNKESLDKMRASLPIYVPTIRPVGTYGQRVAKDLEEKLRIARKGGSRKRRNTRCKSRKTRSRK
jgi:hypothetical protein